MVGTLTPVAENITLDTKGRSVFRGVEHGDIDIPSHLLIDGDRLDLYESISQRGLFHVRGSGSKITLQAGNAIGLIPINDRVAIEIDSRVPIRNLERLIGLVDNYVPKILEFDRVYEHSDQLPRSLIDTITDALLNAIEALRDEGLYKSYSPRTVVGAPSGRLFPFRSALAQRQRGRPIAVSSRFERSIDNAVNGNIKAALVLLLALYAETRDKAGGRKRTGRISRALGMFDGVSKSRPTSDADAIYVREPGRLPEIRPNLIQATTLSSLVLSNSGVQIRDPGAALTAPSVLIQMDDVFERYVRQFLRLRMATIGNFEVLDGNLLPPVGGSGLLFAESLSTHGNSKATPDTLVNLNGNTRAII